MQGENRSFDVTILPREHVINNCVIQDLIGFGVFGVTYRASDVSREKTVAIKEYFPKHISVRSSDFSVQPVSKKHEAEYYLGLNHFLEVARTISRLEHLNFSRVYSFFQANNSAYIIMRYEKGQNLDGLRKTRQFSETEILNITSNVLNALELLHSDDLIHKEIRPENIIIRENGSPVLVNFGSTYLPHKDSIKNLRHTMADAYTPIERYRASRDNGKHGAWTDIYSMSATLYYSISGISPSSAVTRNESIMLTKRDTCVPIELIARNQYSKNLLRAVDKGLAFKHEDRPQSIAEWRSMFM